MKIFTKIRTIGMILLGMGSASTVIGLVGGASSYLPGYLEDFIVLPPYLFFIGMVALSTYWLGGRQEERREKRQRQGMKMVRAPLKYKRMGIVGIIIGALALSLPFCFILASLILWPCPILGPCLILGPFPILGPLAIILGELSRRGGFKWGIAGIVFGIISILFWFTLWVLLF